MNESSAYMDPAISQVEYERLPLQVYVLGGALILIGLLTLALMSNPALKGSYVYLFFFFIPANAAISVFPHEPVLLYYGTFANIWISATAAIGGTILAAYLDHRVFVPVLNHQRLTGYKEKTFYRKAIKYFMRFPFATLVVIAFLPIPFFPFKFLYFSNHYPLSRYVAAVALARFPRYLLLLWAGSAFGIPKQILIGAVLVIFSVYAYKGAPVVWRRLRARREAALQGEADTA